MVHVSIYQGNPFWYRFVEPQLFWLAEVKIVGSRLHVGGQEGHGVEEPTDPNGFQQLPEPDGADFERLRVAACLCLSKGRRAT